jgi:hypothetical protein
MLALAVYVLGHVNLEKDGLTRVVNLSDNFTTHDRAFYSNMLDNFRLAGPLGAIAQLFLLRIIRLRAAELLFVAGGGAYLLWGVATFMMERWVRWSRVFLVGAVVCQILSTLLLREYDHEPEMSV